MNWLNVLGLTAGALVLYFAMLRVERRMLWLVLVLLVVPAVLAIARWAAVGNHWAETITGFGLAGVITAAWWLLHGRRLPPPSSDNIKVWGQEAKPKARPQDTAALEAEVRRLKEEAARMEAELRRLKGANGKRHDQLPPDSRR